MLTGREKSSLVGGARGSVSGGPIVEELPEARLDEVAASFGVGLLRSDVGIGEVDAGRNQGGVGGEDADRRRQLPPRHTTRSPVANSELSKKMIGLRVGLGARRSNGSCKAEALAAAFGVQSYMLDGHTHKIKRAMLILAFTNMLGFRCTFMVTETKGRSLEEISREDKGVHQGEMEISEAKTEGRSVVL
ncbi:hypothetical protein NL676_020825 [Syzygium grande]|nr:hypothetical protein NL676_020825 [Syzygium grande]